MKRFLINILLFAIPVIAYPFFLWAYNKFSIPQDDHTCYIWGDSQLYEGLDLAFLNKNSGYHCISAAQHGAGIYDFLVFSEIVPENSCVIFAISRTVLLRRKEKDKSTSAINFKSLYRLVKNNYSFPEISRIILRNIKPHQIFFPTNSLMVSNDSITIAEPISVFKSIYSQRPTYFYDKRNLYFEGIQNLIEKNCRIIALVLPFHPILNEIENGSPYKRDLMQFDDDISKYFEKKVVIEIRTSQNIFADLTHLNKRGAESVSREVLPYTNFRNKSVLLKIIKSP